ncbi:MAG: hypothetical protein K6G80_01335, partial [Treponema sp.]|nr:hypothetical protein [Treponema sp.]
KDVTYTVKATVEDYAGNTLPVTFFNIQKDSEEPEFKAPSFTGTSTTYSVYKPNKDVETYYINNTDGTFTLTGTATDNFGISRVELEITGKDEDGNVQTHTDSSTGANYTFSEIDFTEWVGEATAVLVVTDLAGNTNTKKPLVITVLFDSEAPQGVHALDDLYKDLYFRFGDDNNDRTLVRTWNSSLDELVGGKYSKDTYGNANTLKIRGRMDDPKIGTAAGSGVKLIYYTVIHETEERSYDYLKLKAETFLDNIQTGKLTSATGYFGPLAAEKEETRRIFYTDADGKIKRKVVDENGKIAEVLESNGEPLVSSTTKDKKNVQYYTNVTTNYSSTLSGFDEGINYLIWVAVDNVGNAGLDPVVVGDAGTSATERVFYNASINVDTVVPDTTTDATETFYTNGSSWEELDEAGETVQAFQTITISGTAVDDAAGVKSVVIKANGKEITEESTTYGTLTVGDSRVEEGKKKRDWNVVINCAAVFGGPDDKDTSTDGSQSITAVVTDAAGTGNYQPVPVGNVKIDKTAPTVTLSRPTDADSSTSGIQVNGTISLTGTIFDSNILPENAITALEYRKQGESVWTRADGITLSGNSTYTITGFDTTQLDDETDYELRAVATDTAGNEGYSDSVTVTVSQDTDRPEITCNNITLSVIAQGATTASPMRATARAGVSSSVIYGSVKDDDGVYSFEYSFDGEDWQSTYSDSDGFEQDVYVNGSWQLAIPEGEPNVYFRVTDTNGDAAGKTFTASTGKSENNVTVIDLDAPKLKDTKSNLYGYRTGSGATQATNVYDTVLYVKVDVAPPSIDYKYYTRDASVESFDSAKLAEMDAYTSAQIETAGWKSLPQISAEFFGGPDSCFYVWVKASDPSGIAELYLTHNFASSLTTLTPLSYKQVAPVTVGGNTTPGYYIGLYKVETSSGDDGKALNVVASDGAGRTTETVTVNLDNTPPTLNLESHTKDGASVFGSISTTLTGTATDSHTVQHFYYAVTDSATAPAAGNAAWKDISEEVDVLSRWTINFDGAENTEGTVIYHDQVLNAYISAWVADNSYAELTTVYFWYYAADEFGNASTPVSRSLSVNPQADKPLVSVGYPATGEKLGGTIRITGTTVISAKEIDSVWIQIDPEYDGTAFNESGWQEKMQARIEDNNITGYAITTETISGSANGGVDTTVTGIKASNTSFWNLTVNASGELENINAGSGEYWPVAIRAFAVSSTGKISDYVDVHVTMDPDNPLIGDSEELRLVQYDNAGNIVRSKKYESDMWISGLWYLVGSIEDSSGIMTVDVKKGDKTDHFVVNSSIVTGTSSDFGMAYSDMIKPFTKKDADETTLTSGYSISIPVGSSEADGYGSLSYSIYAVEDTSSGLHSERAITLHYDNKKPEFEAELEATGNDIVQQNYTYTLDGTFDEANQSGFDKIAMYFTRDLDGVTYVVDPMVSMGTAGTSNREQASAFDGGAVHGSDGLYWKKATTTGAVTGSTISVTPPANARKGGLCKVNDVIYTLSAVSASSVTLDKTPASTTQAVDIYFATALVIDHEVTESGFTTAAWSSSFNNLTDDGDQMLEGVTHSGAKFTWTASIDSSNILDGPLTIHFVAFDKAGNITSKSYSGTVKNNAPRIARLTYGTDNDASGDVSADEMTGNTGLYIYEDLRNDRTFYGKESATKNVDTLTIGSSENARLTIKGNTRVIPEIVGGNGGLGYSYKIGGAAQKILKYDADGKPYKESGVIATELLHEYTNASGESLGTDATGIIRGTASGDTDDDIRELLAIDISTLEFLVNNSSYNSATVYPVEFKIWDKTEGTTFGSTSPCATITLYSKIAITSSSTPEINVEPFYWKSATDNSLFEGSSANGHIELEADWKLTETYTKSSPKPTTGEYDADPKVSGIIKFKGAAQDDVMLKKLSITIDDFAGGEELEFATRGSDGAWSTHAYNDSDGWGWKLVSDTNDQAKGNVVEWEFYLNTAMLESVAKTDVKVDVKSYNRGVAAIDDTGLAVTYTNPTGSTASSTVTKTGALTSHYRMDVVPYITGIKNEVRTALKGEAKSSVFGRSSTGAYPVYYYSDAEGNDIASKQEEFTVIGFNFGSEPKISVNGGSATVGAAVTVGSGMTSGGVIVTVGDDAAAVSSLNNLNYNGAKGDFTADGETGYTLYKNYYNRQPNNINNSTLNDDCNVYVWNIQLVVEDKGVRYPTMRVGADGTVGWAYGSGSAEVRMKLGDAEDYLVDTSYTQWYDTAVAVDNRGQIYGAAQNGDTGGSGTYPSEDSYRNKTNFKLYAFTSAVAHSRRYSMNSGAYSSGGRSSALENIEHDGVVYSQRIRNPKIVAKSNGDVNLNSSVYIAYYDSAINEVVFRQGTITSEHAKDNKYTNFSEYGKVYFAETEFLDGLAPRESNQDSAEGAVSIADSTLAGEYVALGVTNAGKAVVAWYASDAQALYYKYQTNNGWSDAKLIDEGSEFVGWYVDLVVDGVNGVHIAYYAASTGDLKYAYLQDYTKPNEAKVMTVDSYLSSGTNISISVKNTGTTDNPVYVPYISSYMSAFNKTKYTVRTAWITDGALLKSASQEALAGVQGESDDFSGVWEVMTIPLATGSIPLDYSVGIGIKDDNPILGYGTQAGLETAMLK